MNNNNGQSRNVSCVFWVQCVGKLKVKMSLSGHVGTHDICCFGRLKCIDLLLYIELIMSSGFGPFVGQAT